MSGSFAAASSASSSSVRVDVADRELPVERRERSRSREPARTRRRAALVAIRLTRSRLGEPQPARGSSTGTPRSSSRGIASRRKSRTASSSSSASVGSAVEAMPPSASRGSISVDLPGQRAARIARAQEREDVVAALPQQRGRQAERRVVGRLQPELEHEARSPSSALVEVRPSGHGAVERLARPSSTQGASRRSSAA